jgi:two-component system, OmpR family, heavy metal sensor histidine kinase CusS
MPSRSTEAASRGANPMISSMALAVRGESVLGGFLRRSIRARLTFWYALVLAAGMCVFGGLSWAGLRYKLLADIERDQQGWSKRFEKYFLAQSEELSGRHLRGELVEFSQALPPGEYIRLRGDHFSFQYPAADVFSGRRYQIVRRQFPAGGEMFDLEVGAPIREVENTLRLLGILLLVLMPVVIGAACVGGAWLSGRALKPVKEATAAALMISIENLAGRLPVPPTEDEVARLTQVLNLMLERLEAAVRALSQFAADASHELRTPLAVIRATAEAAARRKRPAEEYRAALSAIASDAERMTRLIEDLLTMARSGTSTVEMPLEALDLRDVVGRACDEMRSLGEARQIRFLEALGAEPLWISGNEAALHRLFLVLLDNAVKYSHPGGVVRVTAEAAGVKATVAVEDSGVGISAADLPHIFERFYRAGPVESGEGHGLGLTLAESIARAHGASIEAQSQERVGSVFRVCFPVRDSVGQGRFHTAKTEVRALAK